VGSSGSTVRRLGLVVASALSLPALTCAAEEATLSTRTGTWPAMTSATAGALPLYGTCTMSIPAVALNISAARWVEVPLPDDA